MSRHVKFGPPWNLLPVEWKFIKYGPTHQYLESLPPHPSRGMCMHVTITVVCYDWLFISIAYAWTSVSNYHWPRQWVRNEVNAALMMMFVIKYRLTTAYHPQANGLDERYNQTLINSLSKFAQTTRADGWIQAGKDSTFPFVEEEACRQKGEIHTEQFQCTAYAGCREAQDRNMVECSV